MRNARKEIDTMSYFPYGSIEEEILADTQYTQRNKNASNIEVLTALIKVSEYFADEVKREGENNENI